MAGIGWKMRYKRKRGRRANGNINNGWRGDRYDKRMDHEKSVYIPSDAKNTKGLPYLSRYALLSSLSPCLDGSIRPGRLMGAQVGRRSPLPLTQAPIMAADK